MIKRQIPRLPGMRDVEARAHQQSQQSIDTLRDNLADRGYSVIDTPLLEETELFVRKSGGEISGRLYTFTDPGGHRVSLRPEFTSSVIRHFIERQESLSTPVRWQYSGPVFRYQHDGGSGYRQFTQVGAELIGLEGPEADAEVISLACQGLGLLSLQNLELRLGHLGLLHEVLSSFSLSESARLFIVGNVQALKTRQTSAAALKERAEHVGLLSNGHDMHGMALPKDVSDEAAQELIQGLLGESMAAPVGSRSTEHIVARLLRKLRDSNDPAIFEEALSLVEDLSQLSGPPREVEERARSVVSSRGFSTGPFDRLEGLTGLLEQKDLSGATVVLDLGLARGISYYTGVIFELMHQASRESDPVSLGGGGRYDGLVKALGGGSDVPALGFAYNLDQIVSATSVTREGTVS